MKKKSMKWLIMLTVIAFMAFPALKAQENLRINLDDGTVIEIPLNEIAKLTFDLTTDLDQRPELLKQLLKLKAYPNPAKDFVTFDYSLPEQGKVLIEIFNISGIRQQSLDLGLQQEGDYQYRWNTLHLSSGTYICRIQQNNQIVSEKIIVKK